MNSRPKTWEHAHGQLAAVRAELGEAVFGQEQAISLSLAVALANGHGLIIGPPGVAKTRLVRSLARVLGLEFKRIQFTPDLMPADITGADVLEEDAKGKKSFRFVEGPVFAPMILADEINRASPRTQSALLEAMQERQVTASGVSRALPAPFLVFATQNPLESEGVYPLPEAQLDRFLAEIDMDFPDEATERRVLIEAPRHTVEGLKPVLNPAELLRLQGLIPQIPVGDSVIHAILALVRRLRPETAARALRDQIRWGPGPRGAEALLALARARAVIEGRMAPSVEDVIVLAAPALKHRMAVTLTARADGVRVADLITKAAAGL